MEPHDSRPPDKESALAAWLAARRHVAIGFSGGVDSAYLAVVALHTLGERNVLAIIGRSASYPAEQWATARRVAEEFGTRVSDRVTLLGMHTVEHAGAGCACGGHARVRHLLGGIFKEEGVIQVVDLEAGLEHLSRGTDRHVDLLLVVMEPYFKALEAARRVTELARELGIPHVAGVANKYRSQDELKAIRDYAKKHELELVGEIPFDEKIQRADLAAVAPDLRNGSAAVKAVSTVVDRLGL